MSSLAEAFWAFVFIVILLLAGKLIRGKVKILQTLFLPSAIIAGALGLLLGPEILGRLTGLFLSEDSYLANGLFSTSVLDVWGQIPGLLISVVFASLFIGKSIAPPREIWRDAGPMVVHGQIIAWGQYVIGILLLLFVLAPIWNMDPLAGALIEISFEGGHGTAAGLASTFEELGFADGADLAIGLATIGVVAGVLIGTLLVNFFVRRGDLKAPGKIDSDEQEQLSAHEEREIVEAEKEGSSHMVDPLSIHLGYIGLAIALGWLILEGLVVLERYTSVALGAPELMPHIPLFPLAMIGGVMVQLGLDYSGRARHIDRKLVNRVAGTSLDLLIVSALATISLAAIGAHFWPFVLIAVAGILWNIFAFWILARLIFKKHWVTYGMANFGQCMGMTVIGLLLIRMCDPENRTGAMHSFGYKQLLFEPVVGGGLFTAASLPLIAQFGPVAVLIFTSVIMLGWLLFGYFRFIRVRSTE